MSVFLRRAARNCVVPKVGSRIADRNLIVMTAQQNAAFAELLEAWNRREDVRSSGADVRDLGAARVALEDARWKMFRILPH